MMEISLWISIYPDGTFEVVNRIFDLEEQVKESVLKLDYNYIPWPRFNGNLLWL